MTPRQAEIADRAHLAYLGIGFLALALWVLSMVGGCSGVVVDPGVPVIEVTEATGEGSARLVVSGTPVDIKIWVRLLVTEDDTFACPALTVRVGPVTIDGVLPDAAPECVDAYGVLPTASTPAQHRPF